MICQLLLHTEYYIRYDNIITYFSSRIFSFFFPSPPPTERGGVVSRVSAGETQNCSTVHTTKTAQQPPPIWYNNNNYHTTPYIILDLYSTVPTSDETTRTRVRKEV